MSGKHLGIIVPVYNEGKVIKRVINSIPHSIQGVKKVSIICVNDGSTDNSAEEILKTRAILVEHALNMGVGSATVTGLEAAKLLNVDLAVTLDGDGQHDPSEIARIIRPILEKKADVVIGIRKINTKSMPLIKKFGNWGMSFITSILSGHWVADSQSGFKAFSRQAIEIIKLDGPGYEVCSEMIIEFKKNNLRITEVPVKVIYSEYSKKKGQSIFNGTNIIIQLLIKKLTKPLW